MELSKWLGYVNQTYGQYIQFVNQQGLGLMMGFPNFKPCVESMQFPGDPQPFNLLIFKGHLDSKGQQFAIKCILQRTFPYGPPKLYIDQQISAEVVKAK